jgi:hypothetical protein
LKNIGSILGIILIVLLAICGTGNAYAADKTAIDVSSVAVGARPISLGGSYIALADDASAVFTNPAGIGMYNNISFTSMSTQLLTVVNYQMAAFAYPTEYGNFGIGYIGINSPAGTYTYMAGSDTVEAGEITYFKNLFVLTYGNDISEFVADRFYIETNKPKVSYGVSLKMAMEGLSGSVPNAPNAQGYMADAGLLYKYSDSLSFGAKLQNFTSAIDWSTGLKESMPSIFKLGTAWKALSGVTLLMDTDMAMGGKEQTLLHGGVEWQVYPMLAIRTGFDQREQSIDDDTTAIMTAYTAGIGVMYDGFRFDYAYKYDAEFTELSTHYFSFCFNGPEIPKPLKADESVRAQDSMQSNPSTEQIKTNEPEKAKPLTDDEKLLKEYEKLMSPQ